jgi:hypothetical protein
MYYASTKEFSPKKVKKCKLKTLQFVFMVLSIFFKYLPPYFLLEKLFNVKNKKQIFKKHFLMPCRL